MSDSLPALEAQRAAIQRQISELGDICAPAPLLPPVADAATHDVIAMQRMILAMDPFTASRGR